jgi:hypothetical protein
MLEILEEFFAQLSVNKLLWCRGRTILATSRNDVVMVVRPDENNVFANKNEAIEEEW